MKSGRLALICAGVLLPALAGCGSSTPPPFAVSCTTHKLRSGAIQARLSVSNSTSKAGHAVIYGPALSRVRFIKPVLRPAEVNVVVSHNHQTYVGFVIPRIRPDKPARLILHLTPSRHSGTIVASRGRVVHAEDWHILDNSDCTIR